MGEGPGLGSKDERDDQLAVRRSHPETFRQPLPPLPEMVEAAGLEMWRGYVGVPGAPWYGEPPGLGEVSRIGLWAWWTMLSLHRTTSEIPGSEEPQWSTPRSTRRLRSPSTL